MLNKVPQSRLYFSLFLSVLGLLASTIPAGCSRAANAAPTPPAIQRSEGEQQVFHEAVADEERGLGLQEPAYAALSSQSTPAPRRTYR